MVSIDLKDAYLSVSMHGCSTQKVLALPVARPSLRIPVPSLRIVQRSENLHKVTQAGDGSSKAARSAFSHLPRRYTAVSTVQGGSIIPSNPNVEVARTAGICDQSRHVTAGSNADNTISGFHNIFPVDDNQSAIRQGGTDKAGLSMGSQSTNSVSEGPVSHHRPIDSIHSSSAPSPLTQHPFKQCSQPPYTASIQAVLPAPLHSIHSSSAPSPLTQHPFKQCSQPPYTASIQAVLPAPLHSIHSSSAPSPLTQHPFK